MNRPHSAKTAPDRLPLAAPPPDGLAFFSEVVSRLEAAVATETAALRENRPVDLADIHRQKRQGLLELSRLMPRLAGVAARGAVRDRLASLTALLDANRAVIDVQLRAVHEVADIIAGTLKEAESDGTYSRLAGAIR